VFAARSIADEFLALAPTEEARVIVHRHVEQTRYLDVSDPGIFADIDTPEAYQRLLAETRA
jgi:CTP:molybdopterin cytidylyltransferase MocA